MFLLFPIMMCKSLLWKFSSIINSSLTKNAILQNISCFALGDQCNGENLCAILLLQQGRYSTCNIYVVLAIVNCSQNIFTLIAILCHAELLKHKMQNWKPLVTWENQAEQHQNNCAIQPSSIRSMFYCRVIGIIITLPY